MKTGESFRDCEILLDFARPHEQCVVQAVTLRPQISRWQSLEVCAYRPREIRARYKETSIKDTVRLTTHMQKLEKVCLRLQFKNEKTLKCIAKELKMPKNFKKVEKT